MHWVVQENLFNEQGYDAFMEVLVRFNIPHSVHKVVPFSHELIPDIEPPTPCMVMGGTTLCRVAAARGWTPGSFLNENFDFEVQRKHWGEAMLNHDSLVCGFADVPEQEGEFFMRPVHDTKSLNGMVLDWPTYSEWRDKVVNLGEDTGATLRGDTPVQVAQPKNILEEWRLWVVDGQIVTYSLYKSHGRVFARPECPEDALAFARSQTALWIPARAFVMDVASTRDGYKVIEVNNINSAGLYAASVSNLVLALDSQES